MGRASSERLAHRRIMRTIEERAGRVIIEARDQKEVTSSICFDE